MTLVIRADGDAHIGTGHILRCLALAEAWPGDVTFATLHLSDPLAARIHDAGHRLIQMDSEGDLGAIEMDRLVLDGYDLPHAHQTLAPSLVIDDGARVGAYDCRWVTDPNPAQDPRAYTQHGATALVGPRYAIIAPSYQDYRPEKPTVRDGPVLVSLGGNAPFETWTTIMDELDAAGIDAVYVFGGAQERVEELRKRTHQPTHHDTPSLAPLLAKARFAILGGGSTNWEACVTGTPRAVICLADNQEEIVQTVVERQAAIQTRGPGVAQQIQELTESQISTMAQAAWDMCDGLGAKRIVEAMR